MVKTLLSFSTLLIKQVYTNGAVENLIAYKFRLADSIFMPLV